MNFLRLIKKDCLYTLSKALSIKYEDIDKEIVDFQIEYTQDNGYKHYFGFSFSPKCDMSGIFPADEFSNDFLNEREEAKKFRNALINNKKIFIDSFWVCVYTNTDKVLHKNKFYKKLHDEIVAAVWDPNWYLDFEELRELNKRWSKK